MGTVENLIAAKALIDTPEKWNKGSYGNGKDCFCVLGAFDHMGVGIAGIQLLRPFLEPEWRDGVVKFNDHPDTTHADIMALFDRAIAAEKAKEAYNA